MKDYRFDVLAYSLREDNRTTYAFSNEASLELARNDNKFQYPDDMWDDFWEELQREYTENQL